jgi:molybdopterin biosynthesis enzyme MoaB
VSAAFRVWAVGNLPDGVSENYATIAVGVLIFCLPGMQNACGDFLRPNRAWPDGYAVVQAAICACRVTIRSAISSLKEES